MYQNISEVLKTSLNEIEETKISTHYKHIYSGLIDLDRITGGWQKKDLIVVAARPSMGKTSFALNFAYNSAIRLQKPTCIFSPEMTSSQLVNKLISKETEIEQTKIRSGNLFEWEWQKLHAKLGKLEKAPLFLDDTLLNITEFKERCIALKDEYELEIVIIDNLQLIKGAITKNGYANREQEIGSVVREIKSIAKELNLMILATSNLSRSLENRLGQNGKRPILSDLRESGAIEQDSDMVIFLYRPEYYGIIEDENGHSTMGICEAIVGKNRHGENGVAPLRFIERYSKFTNIEDDKNSIKDLEQDELITKKHTIRPSSMNDIPDDDPPF